MTLSVATNASLPRLSGGGGGQTLTPYVSLSAKGEAQEASGSPLVQATTDLVTYALDFTALVSPGDSISSPVLSIWSTTDGTISITTSIVLSGPTVSGNQVQFVMHGLTAGATYHIYVSATFNTYKVLSSWFRIWVPF